MLLVLPFVFNLLIDPYGYFQIVEIPRINANKSEVLSEYSTKYYYVKRAKPEVIMLGTSRMLTHDPRDVGKYTGGRVYNLALSGSSMYEQYEYFKYVADRYPLRCVVIGLDFFSFNPENTGKTGFDEDRLKGFYYKDYVNGLIGLEALKASVLTLKSNVLGSCMAVNYDEGYQTWCSREKAVKDSGEGVIERAMKSSLKTFSKDKEAYNSEKFRNPGSIERDMAFLSKIAQLCRERGIRLKVFISPIYAAQFDLIYAMGLGRTYEQWKTEVTKVVDYYDFTGRNSVTVDEHFWWDSSHIRKEGGKLIFARIFDDAKTAVPPDFGVHVSAKNVHDHLTQLRAQVEENSVSDIINLYGY